MKKINCIYVGLLYVFCKISLGKAWTHEIISEKFEVGDEFIVKFSHLSKRKNLHPKILEKYHLKRMKNLDFPYASYSLIKLDSNRREDRFDPMDLRELLLAEDPSIEYIEPNYIYSINAPEDPSFLKLWGLWNNGKNEPPGSRGQSSPSGIVGVDINALKAWSITKGSRAVKVAIIDTGFDYNHQDLKSNIWVNTSEKNGVAGVDDDNNGYVDDIYGYDFANMDGDPMDGNGHGTHVAGTIGAEHDNGIGVAGVMGDVEMVGIKFLTDQGSGTTINAIEAINYAVKLDVDIMNNSWGGGAYSKALKEAIAYAGKMGILFTAAAGNSKNDNDLRPTYPSNYDLDNIISIAAHNYAENLSSFSCYGANSVDIAAPGENIYSTMPEDKYTVLSGTSMATPHVTGLLGLYISVNGRTNIKKIKNELLDSSVYVPSYGRKLVSAGRVDGYNFLNGIYPSRPETPDHSKWKDFDIPIFETEHPYLENENSSVDYTIPAAKFVRAVINKLSLENGYDYFNILNEKGEKIQALTGDISNYATEYVHGDTIRFHMQSDNSVQTWGVLIKKIQYID